MAQGFEDHPSQVALEGAHGFAWGFALGRKAERFIRTLLGECSYARLYRSNAARLATLPGWLAAYNYLRPHTAPAGQTPMRVLVDKAGGNHS